MNINVDFIMKVKYKQLKLKQKYIIKIEFVGRLLRINIDII